MAGWTAATARRQQVGCRLILFTSMGVFLSFFLHSYLFLFLPFCLLQLLLFSMRVSLSLSLIPPPSGMLMRALSIGVGRLLEVGGA